MFYLHRHADHNSIIKNGGHLTRSGLRVFFTGSTVAMVTIIVKKISTTCLPMSGHLFDNTTTD